MTYSEDDARRLLLAKIDEIGARQVAQLAGCGESWVSQVKFGHKKIGQKLAAVLGLEVVTEQRYRRAGA